MPSTTTTRLHNAIAHNVTTPLPITSTTSTTTTTTTTSDFTHDLYFFHNQEHLQPRPQGALHFWLLTFDPRHTHVFQLRMHPHNIVYHTRHIRQHSNFFCCRILSLASSRHASWADSWRATSAAATYGSRTRTAPWPCSRLLGALRLYEPRATISTSPSFSPPPIATASTLILGTHCITMPGNLFK